MREETFVAVQDLAAPRPEVFAFFADPANLEALTPPWLRFEVLTPRPLPRGEGALFDYRIRVRGLPLRWRTLIETFVPGEVFVDRQLAGPYALWHHTHRFEDLPGGGTRMTPIGVGARNPAFDVTPAELVTAIITDRGVFTPAELGRAAG